MLTFDELLQSKERNRKKKKYFPDFWLSKGYLEPRAYYLAEKFYTNTISEYDLNLTKCKSIWNKNLWLSRGYTENEAIEKVKSYQKENGDSYSRKYTKEERKKFTTTCIEFYLTQGLSEEEAAQALKKRQTTFSLEICIEKYGKEEGIKVFKQRQDKWQDTLNSKSQEEKDLMNSKKRLTLENFIRKYGKEEGSKRYYSWLNKLQQRLIYETGFLRFSRESINWFNSFIPCHILDNAMFGENEFFIYDKKNMFFYDFKYKNVIVEYHGHTYHYNPKIKNLEWKSPFGITREESLEKDRFKRELALSRGFKFFEYYSNDSKEYENHLKDQILKALHEETNY